LDKEQLAMFGEPAATLSLDRDTFLRWMARSITGAISDAWDSEKYHVVFHSGGWDSRVVSAATHRLYAARGDEWLGHVLFACVGNECDASWAVLEAEGWDRPGVFLGIRDAGPLVSRMTDIHDAGRWLNGVQLQGVDFNWLLVEHLQDIGAIPDNDDEIQVFNGRNETLMGATMPDGNKLSASWSEAYDASLSVSRYKAGEVAFPFSSYAAVSLGIASTTRMDWSTQDREANSRFRRDMGIILCPALDGIPNTDLEMPELSVERVAEMGYEYSRSWYGQMIWPDAQQDRRGRLQLRHPWWGAWTAAALCEALIAEGYELSVN
jgi:hypothetical protein